MLVLLSHTHICGSYVVKIFAVVSIYFMKFKYCLNLHEVGVKGGE